MARFERTERIRRRSEFQRVYDEGVRLHGRYATLFVLPNDRTGGRLGIAATKRLGGAVVRNRVKRLIREVFRRNKPTSGLDVVVVPKRALLDVTLDVLEAEYRSTLARRFGARRTPGAPRL